MQRDAVHRASAATQGDGLIWPAEGRFFGPPDGVVFRLWSGQTTARNTPGQKTRKNGQMDQPEQSMLYTIMDFYASIKRIDLMMSFNFIELKEVP